MVTMPAQSPSLSSDSCIGLRSSVKSEGHDHDDARRRVDEEDRLPAVVLGQIAADGRTDRRREGDGEREGSEPDRLLRLRQLGQHHGEGHRDEHAAGEALQAAQDDHRAEVVREGAGDREQREQHRVRQHVAAEREDPAQIVGQRDDHDLADQIGGRDPGAVVDAGADAALDVEQRGIGDLDVQDRHEGADHAGEHGDPGRQARLLRGAGDGAENLRSSCVAAVDMTLLPKPESDAGVDRPLCGPARRRSLRVAGRLGVDRRDDRHAGTQHDVEAGSSSSTIFTGMRWTTLVKLPVALSGGSSANSWPLAGERLSTRPRKTRVRDTCPLDLDGLAGAARWRAASPCSWR